MSVATGTRVHTLELLAEEYLEATRCAEQAHYDEVEPWAWQRLEKRLRAIRVRRERIYARGRQT